MSAGIIMIPIAVATNAPKQINVGKRYIVFDMLRLELRLGIGGKELKEISGNTFPDVVCLSDKEAALLVRYFRYSFTDDTGTGVYIEANGICI